MKGKGNGLEAIKKLALQHGEKVVMLLVVALTGWLIYGTTTHEPLPEAKAPQKLISKATELNEAVANYTWNVAQQEAPGEVRIFEEIKSENDVNISSQPYYDPTNSGLEHAIVEEIQLRRDPKLLAVTDFEGYGVTGLFAYYDEERMKEIAKRALVDDLEREREREREAEKMRREMESGRRPGRGPRGGGGRGEMGDFGGGFGFEGGMEAGFGPAGDLADMRPVPFPVPRAGVEVAGEELIRQSSCAVVTAKVPLPEQITEFKKALANTRTYRPDRDFPQYKGYIVEKAEVTGSGELNWQPVRFPNGLYDGRIERKPYVTGVSFDGIEKITANWAGGMDDLYDPRYGHEALTMPLAPLVGRNWDDMAYHSEVPSAMEAEQALMEEEAARLAGENAPREGEEGAEGDLDIFRGGTDSMDGVGRGGEMSDYPRGAGMRSRGGMGGEMGMRGGMMGEGMVSRGGGMGMGRMSGMGMGGGGAGPTRARNTLQFDETGELIAEVPFLMLRFFDITVKPGKSYKYRVKLVYADPNYRQSRDVLDPSVATRERKPIILGEWSDASPTISIPQAGRVRVAASQTLRKSDYAEPEATMLVESFDVDLKGNARQAAHKIEKVRRGSVMNYHGEVQMLVQQGRYIKKVEDFTLDTGIVILDLEGGDPQSRELNEPTHALLMDATGKMYLRDELDDEMEYAIHEAIFAEPDKRRPGGMEGGRNDDYGFEGGFDFGR